MDQQYSNQQYAPMCSRKPIYFSVICTCLFVLTLGLGIFGISKGWFQKTMTCPPQKPCPNTTCPPQKPCPNTTCPPQKACPTCPEPKPCPAESQKTAAPAVQNAVQRVLEDDEEEAPQVKDKKKARKSKKPRKSGKSRKGKKSKKSRRERYTLFEELMG